VRTILTVICAVLLLHSVANAQVQTVQWADERLTVQATNASLRALFEEVAQRTGIVVTGADRLIGFRSLDIRDKPLAEALEVLLEHVNFVVTREKGLFHLRIHSMSGAAPAAVSPIVVPGLTDRVVTREQPIAEIPGQPDPDDDEREEREEAQREEQEELAALEQVAEGKAPDRVEEITNALQSDYAEVRIRALHLLVAHPSPDVIEEIVSTFEDDEPNVALTASDILATMPADAVLEALERQLAPDVSYEAQFAALRALALRGDVASIPAVRRAVSEGAPQLRAFAAALVRALETRARTAAKPKG
jgi:hypothetical protein